MQRNNMRPSLSLTGITLLAAMLAGLLLLSACGQKGDLYLPPEETQQQD